MKKMTLRIALTVLCLLGCDGCAMLAPDDRDFYGRGWINPKELDDKPYHPSAHPETTGGLGRTAVPPASNAVPTDPLLQ